MSPRKLGRLAPAGAVVFAVLAAQGLTGVQASAAPEQDEQALVRLTQQYLQDRADRLTGGAKASALTSVSGTAEFTGRLAAEAAELDRRRSSADFSGARVVIQQPDVRFAGDEARVRFVERTELFYAHRSKADSPAAASHRVGHTVGFTRVGGQWKVASDVLDLPQDAVGPLTYAHPVKSGPAAAGPRSKVPAGWVASRPDTPRKAGGENPTVQGPPYSRAAAANYARRWAEDRNPDFPSFGNDCANFTSQALLASGWDMVKRGYNHPDAWWVTKPQPGFFNSHTWSVAQNQADFGGISGRLRNYAGEPVHVGDMLYADWGGDGGPDAHIDHSMIVVQVDDPWDWGQIHLAYHTTDQADITAWDLYTMDEYTETAAYYFFSLQNAY
ncbi:hypothetical protein FKR81_38510 [Lentzea tibetensis]|uniref:Putative amidase domain-containing protein n=1 Tax=Lentzea tibetensis TaxID=2591470 RepID=A0A563EGV4_9PSEU|nr:amidase domain-containing protein [Lentzea tibetensis]TWP45727.1 hypothetical protein FKR81_38510 [Lentzea tibetensis]